MGRLAGAAAIIFLGNVASRLLGLAREIVIAALFGATGATSAYRTAARVATVVYDLLVSGAISAALVPVFSEYADAGGDALARVVGAVLALLGLALAVVLLLLGVFAPAVVGVLGADPGYFALTVTLTRWALASVLLLGLAGVLTAALYARRDFKWAALATAAYNAGIIAAALALAPLWGVEPDGTRPDASILALAIGLVVGALLQVLVQLPGLRDLRFPLALAWRHPGVRTALRLYAPVAAGFAVTNVGVVVDTRLAWLTGEASLAILQAATTLVQFPLGLVSSAVALAALPTLARAASASSAAAAPATAVVALPAEDADPPRPLPEGSLAPDGAAAAPDYLTTLAFALRLVLLLIVPATVGLVALREPVVAWLFQRGEWTAAATAETARAFLFYAPQLPLVALDQLFITAFYARRDTLTPVLVGVLTVLLYLVTAPALCTCVDLPLLGRAELDLGRDGLALANALQNGMHGAVMFLLVWRQFPALAHGLGSYLARIVAAALVMGGVLLLMQPALAAALGTGVGARVVVSGLLGVGVYATLLLLLRVQEARALGALVLARLRRRG